MRSSVIRSAIALLIVGCVTATSTFAVMLVRMNLGDMVGRADSIFSGTIIGATSGTVKAGGASPDTRSYRVAFEKIAEVLGWTPKWTVRDGAEQVYEVHQTCTGRAPYESCCSHNRQGD